MLDKYVLKKILDSRFTGRILSKGYQLYTSGEVKLIEFDDHNHSYEAQVNDGQLFTVQFDYSNSEIGASLSCDCKDFTNCAHQSALVYFLYHQLKSDKKELLFQTTNTGFNNTSLSSNYRTIDYSSGMFQALNRYKKAVKTWFDFDIINIELTSRSEITTTLGRRAKYYKNDFVLLGDVIIQSLNETTCQIKCNVCSKNSKFLCEHQQLTIQHMVHLDFDQYIFRSDEAEHEIQKLAMEKYGVSKENIAKHFSFLCAGSGRITVVPKSKAAQKNTAFLDAIRDVVPIDIALSERIQEIKKVDQLSASILWLPYEEDEICTIIKGKKRKADGVLSTKIEIVKDSNKLDGRLKTFLFELKEIKNAHEGKNGLQKALSLLQSMKESFINQLQYYPTNFYEYYQNNTRTLRCNDFYFQPELLRIVCNATIQDEIYIAKFEFFAGEKLITISEIDYINALLCTIQNQGYIFSHIYTPTLIDSLDKEQKVIYFPAQQNVFIRFIDLISEFCEVQMSDKIHFDIEHVKLYQKRIYLNQEDAYITFEPKMANENYEFNVLEDQVDISDQSIVSIDKESKKQYVNVLKNLHKRFNVQLESERFLYLTKKEFLHRSWFFDFYDACREYNIEVYGQENLAEVNFSPIKAKITSSIKSGIDWFDVKVDMNYGDESIAHSVWIDAIKNGQKYVKLDNGSLGVIPKNWFDKLSKMLNSAEFDQDQIKISNFNFNIIDELFEDIIDPNIVAILEQRREKLLQIEKLNIEDIEVPETINAVLRDYQLKGFQWLLHLYELEFGGILADDMGLGKTLQALSILAYAIPKSDLPNLVIMPRSLLFNWAAEIEKFMPSLKYTVYHGPRRNRDEQDIKSQNLLLSTYDTLASDISIFAKIDFQFVLLDESQAIKNPNSKRYKAARLLKARHRVAMTGTPIQNNTFDLYAQMSFVNPGCFGSANNFKIQYSNPIDVARDKNVAAALNKVISPFILRRTKEQVAPELPDKTESIIYCEMGSVQRQNYEELKLAIKNDVHELIETQGLQKSKFKILEGLLRLRQMCNATQLVKKNSNPLEDSVKLDELMNLLTGELQNKNVLIFSQFVQMLTIVRLKLNQLNLRYSYLDGSTRDRKSVVNQYMEDDQIRLFLLSLKAGNTGLNLTKADYVFIIDPWWNPAVEAQAIDRTHRIGQDKHVFAYRMICKDSIEEKILKLQEKKLKVASDLITTDEGVIKSLGKTEILALFQ